MQNKVNQLHSLLEDKIKDEQFGNTPLELYEPIRYLMALGGKRLRPILVLLGYNLFKENVSSILNQAMAVEVFHNFTLMHDDIMDNAPIRRGQPTVHEKWNANTAILSGDVMLVKAYDLLLDTSDDKLKPLLTIFNKCAAEVCEGQQFDMIFESKTTVSDAEYIEMIRLKTAVLLGMSLEMGALLANAKEEDKNALKDFGVNIGIGFQLKDDLLDVYADKAKFGKQVGGDIISNKKTFLLINALERAKGKQKKELTHWLEATDFDAEEKVKAVTAIYDELGIKKLTEQKMNEYFDAGFLSLKKVSSSIYEKAQLKKFAEALIDRVH